MTSIANPLQIRTNTIRSAYMRSAASTQATILRKVLAGSPITVTGTTKGESFEQNAIWYSTSDGGFMWSGAFPMLPLPRTTPAPGVTLSPTVRVIDLYEGDGVLDFGTAMKNGLLGVIHKATTGATGIDAHYAARREAAAAAGLLWGAYHWGTDKPVEQQIEHFLQVAKPDKNTLVALDFESSPDHQMSLPMAKQFLAGIAKEAPCNPLLYGGGYLRSELGKTADPDLGKYRLWLAEYGVPKPPVTWGKYWLWQYTDGDPWPGGKQVPNHVPGIIGDSKGKLDCDQFDGTDEELKAQWAS